MTNKDLTTIFRTTAEALQHSPYLTLVFTVHGEQLELVGAFNQQENITHGILTKTIPGVVPSISQMVATGPRIIETNQANEFLAPLLEIANQNLCQQIALLPVLQGSRMAGLVVMGAKAEQVFNEQALQPYAKVVSLTNIALSKEAIESNAEKRMTELELLLAINNAIKTPWDTKAFFAELHTHIQAAIGECAFSGALYDEQTNSIQVPYLFEDGKVESIEAFSMGEGLTSILLRSKQPLLLVEDVENQSRKLGAKVVGRPAKSWMGVPLVSQNKAIGALIVQDLEKEFAYTNDDLQTMTVIAAQVAKILFNARLLDENRQQLLQVQTATEIARDISSALNLDELLHRAVILIRERFNLYHAGIFLIDNARQYAIIREATGEAGAQLKREGFKLAVGSKSIVGFTAGNGEPLIVNDIKKDATYLPNPLLPDTQAEAAIPLKIGEQILGVLDVQSTIPYVFGSNVVNTLQTLADQLSIAVNNSELFAEIQEHLSQHRLLHHITTSAASGTTLDEALTSAVNGLQVTLGGDRVSILLTDSARKNLVVKAWVGYSDNVNEKTIPLGSGVTGWAAAHHKPLRIDDVTKDARYIQVSSNTRSELAVPLIFRNDVLGVLNVESEQIAAYTESDEEMLGTLAGTLAAIIANARLVEQIRSQIDRERILFEITDKIRRSTDIQTIIATTANEIRRVTGARRTQIKIGVEPDAEQ